MSCDGVRSSRVMGTPISVLKLAGLTSTFMRLLSAEASISRVVVLPMLPVMPTTGISNWLRHAAPSLPSAASGSSVSRKAPSGRPDASNQSARTTPAAPAATARRAKTCPSVFSPIRAKKRVPGPESRESALMRETMRPGSAPVRRPPVISAIRDSAREVIAPFPCLPR